MVLLSIIEELIYNIYKFKVYNLIWYTSDCEIITTRMFNIFILSNNYVLSVCVLMIFPYSISIF